MKKSQLVKIHKILFSGNFDIKEGIYFSHKTGKFFEVVSKNGKVKPKYTCGGFAPVVSNYIFKLQYEILDYYELIMEYEK